MAARRYLVVFEGNSSRKVDLPDVGQLVIGRADTCEVHLQDGSASRTHARLEADANGVRLFDLGSANGTLVNGVKVAAPVPLLSGDVITVSQATLVLHAPPRRFPSDPLHDVPTFRRRLDEELERALRYGRPLSVCALTVTPPPERSLLNTTLYRCFRRTDFAAWLSPTQLIAALPEADEQGGREHARRVIASLPEFECRAGLAFSPGDGIELETLITAALDATSLAGPGETAEARTAFRRLVIKEQIVLVADPAMVRLYDLMERVAHTDLPVLVCGEPGTGKELAASTIHHWSERTLERLVTVRCKALGERAGDELSAAIAATAGGTVFVDEIESLSPALQGRLLEALGQAEVRIVAGTGADLDAEVRAGRFRGDVWTKLSKAMLWFVPLRDRPREVPLLARTFLQEAAPALRFSDGAMRRLQEHKWPGNVFELREVVDAVAGAVKGSVVEAEHVDAVLGA